MYANHNFQYKLLFLLKVFKNIHYSPYFHQFNSFSSRSSSPQVPISV